VSRRRSILFAVLVLGASLLAAPVDRVDAGDARPGRDSGFPWGSNLGGKPAGPNAFERSIADTPNPFRPERHPQFPDHRGKFHPGGTVIVGPAPVYISGPPTCYQRGYWAYQWVPQAYGYNVWVPGQWSPDGFWIDGHYQPRVGYTGYYQPYWVEGGYTSCY
jgi:hypothetical protein